MNSKHWYKECGESIRKEFGADSELFIDLLAATSPRKQVSTNWRLAMRIYHVWQNRPPFWYHHVDYRDGLLQGTLSAHRPNILRALRRQPLSGNKVRAFAANLKGNLDVVTLDVWMCRHYKYTGTLTDKKYAELSAIVRAEAKACGMLPAEYQAVVWSNTIKAYGKHPQSYLTVKDRNQMFFEFYFEN